MYSSRPSVGGNSGTWGGGQRGAGLKPEGPKIEAEGRGRVGVLGDVAARILAHFSLKI